MSYLCKFEDSIRKCLTTVEVNLPVFCLNVQALLHSSR